MPNPTVTAARSVPNTPTPQPTPHGAHASATARDLLEVRNTPADGATRTPWRALRDTVATLFSCTGRQPAPTSASAPFSDAALEGWATRGQPSEQRAEAVRRVRAFMADPDACNWSLSLRNLHLRELPPLSPHFPMTLLDAFGNPLRLLPPQLPQVTWMWIDLAPDKFPTRRHAELMRTPPLRDVPYLEIGLPDPWREEHIPLPLGVAMWSPAEVQCAVASEWSGVWLHEGAVTLSILLHKLARAETKADLAESREAFRAGVAAWLAELREDEDLLEKTFEACVDSDAAGTCSDHAITGYLALLRLRDIHCIDRGDYDNDLPTLLQVARDGMRQEHLVGIALDKFRALKRAGKNPDDVEVVLAYLVRLRDDLQLPFGIRGGRWTNEGVSRVSGADLRRALQAVLAREADFDAALDAWPPWQRRLQRWDPARFVDAESKLVEWASDGTFQARLEDYLRTHMPGLVAHAQAHGEAGMAVTAALQREAYGALTKDFLRAHGLASAADAFTPLTRPAPRP